MLTRKQEAFVKELITNPKQSAKAAAFKTYNVTSERSAEVVASELLRKPEIRSKLAEASDLVENTLKDTVIDYGKSDKLGFRTLAVETSKYIHDKIHGKATQKLEQHSTTVNLNLSLTDVISDKEDS